LAVGAPSAGATASAVMAASIAIRFLLVTRCQYPFTVT
jgi:hypothetical protein